jgi:hypothetical protein
MGEVGGGGLSFEQVTQMINTATSGKAASAGSYTTLFRLSAANLNSALDQALIKTWDFSVYVIKEVLITNASAAVLNAKGGIYTAPSKGGVAVVAADTSFASLSTPTDTLNPVLNNGSTSQLTGPLYLSLTTAEGSAVTADVSVMGLAS